VYHSTVSGPYHTQPASSLGDVSLRVWRLLLACKYFHYLVGLLFIRFRVRPAHCAAQAALPTKRRGCPTEKPSDKLMTVCWASVVNDCLSSDTVEAVLKPSTKRRCKHNRLDLIYLVRHRVYLLFVCNPLLYLDKRKVLQVMECTTLDKGTDTEDEDVSPRSGKQVATRAVEVYVSNVVRSIATST